MKEFSSKNSAKIIERIPKVLLHTHLEGSILPLTLAKLVRRNGISLPFPARSDLIADMCWSGGWSTFLTMFLAISSCFRTRYDFRDSVVEYAHSLAKENTLYVELHCTPWNHLSRGVGLDEIGQGLLWGIETARKECGVHVKVIFDLARDPTEDVLSILDWMRDLPRTHFVALGISGGPDSLPLEEFKPHCEQAREQGFRIVAHAGELEGPVSVRAVAEHLGVDRICHGVRVIEDPILLGDLVSKGIHFELCPTSNYILGVGRPQYAAIKNMLTSGAQCSINTDDELLLNTSLTKELYALKESGIIGFVDILKLQHNATSAAFMNASDRKAIMDDLAAVWARLVNDNGS